MYRFGFFFMTIGGMMIYFSFHARSLDERASPDPEEVTLQALIDRGPDANPHVAIKDFVLGQNFVAEQEGANQDHFKTVWLPAMPSGGGPARGLAPAGGAIPAIIKSTSVSNQAALQQLAAAPTIKGMVINKIESLTGQERNLLAQQYPATDFDRCLIIQHNRTPYSAAFRIWLLIGGLALLVLGGALFVGAYAKPKPAPYV